MPSACPWVIGRWRRRNVCRVGQLHRFCAGTVPKKRLEAAVGFAWRAGSQNGWDHSGRSGPINWPKDPQTSRRRCACSNSFAQKYGKHPALHGIELLNEPHWDVPLEILQQILPGCLCSSAQNHLDPNVAVVFHDSFRPLAWKKIHAGAGVQQCDSGHASLSMLWRPGQNPHRAGTASVFHQPQGRARRDAARGTATIVGEWSLSLPGKAMLGLSPLQVTSVTRAYADTQLLNYEGRVAGFFLELQTPE